MRAIQWPAGLWFILAGTSLCLAQERPVLRYVFDRNGAQYDLGSQPAAEGSFVGAAASVPASPGSFSCGSLDLTANGAYHNYLTTSTDVQKIDALGAMTVSMWINLRGTPTQDDCLISDMPSGYPPAGTGGWDLRIIGNNGSPTAAQFQLEFRVMEANGGSNSFQGQPSPNINAENRWVFVAVTYSTSRVRRYYLGDEASQVAQIGFNVGYAFSLLDNTTELRIGSAGSEPTVDRTPPAWIDDVRIYDRVLSTAELDQVRTENLQYAGLYEVPSLMGLGGIPGAACSVYAGAISADGSTAVGQAFGSSSQFAYRWKNGVRSILPDLPGGDESSIAYSVSPDGSIAVGAGQAQAGTSEALMWDAAGNYTHIGDFPGGETWSVARGVSADGSVVVGVGVDRSGYLADAWRYTGGVMHKLGYLPGGSQSAAYDVSRDGRVIVGSSDSTQGEQAFRWQAGAFTALGDLDAGVFRSRANRISANGSVVVGWGSSAEGQEAVAWFGRRAIGLGDLPGGWFQSEAHGVSANGSFIVGKGRGSGPTGAGLDEAFIWDRHNGMRSLKAVLEQDHGLDLTGWRLSVATGISDNAAVITGYGVNPAGLADSFIVWLPMPDAAMDFDGDGDVDSDDLQTFVACSTGPGVPYDPANHPPGCTLVPDALGLLPTDLDLDGDVDSADFAILQRCMGQSGDTPPPDCRG